MYLAGDRSGFNETSLSVSSEEQLFFDPTIGGRIFGDDVFPYGIIKFSPFRIKAGGWPNCRAKIDGSRAIVNEI